MKAPLGCNVPKVSIDSGNNKYEFDSITLWVTFQLVSWLGKNAPHRAHHTLAARKIVPDIGKELMDTNYYILCTSYTLYKDFTTTPHGIYIYSTSTSSSEVYFENNLHESHAEHTCARSVVSRLVACDICRRKQAFNSFSEAHKFKLLLDLIQINI